METHETFLLLLGKNHLRLTKTRKALASIFSQSETPLAVSDILGFLRKSQISVNKTTVYRELERLQKIGVVVQVELGGRKQYYELALREHHHHLICLSCERVEDIDMDEQTLLAQEQRVQSEKQFTILRHSLEFFGLCKLCNSVTV